MLNTAPMMPHKVRKLPAPRRRERLVRLMDEYNLTSEMVGRMLDVHQVTVRRWRTGVDTIPWQSLFLLESLCVGLN